jgi:DNA-binding transcriptional LysR family regulator
MARYWLAPRIRAFRERYPEVGFTVLASDSDDTFRNYARTDMSLLCGNERSQAGEEMHFLFAEIAQPVCTPEFLERHGPFRTPEQLNSVNLLHLHDSHWSAEAIGWHPLGWAEWFKAQGAQIQQASSSLSSNKVSLLLEACLTGEGVMLGFPHLIEQHLNNGKLVTAHEGTVSAGRGNFLICRPSSLQRPEVALFRNALLEGMTD